MGRRRHGWAEPRRGAAGGSAVRTRQGAPPADPRFHSPLRCAAAGQVFRGQVHRHPARVARDCGLLPRWVGGWAGVHARTCTLRSVPQAPGVLRASGHGPCSTPAPASPGLVLVCPPTTPPPLHPPAPCWDAAEDAGFPEACFKVSYDYLVLGVGSINNTFGIQGVQVTCGVIRQAGGAHARAVPCLAAAASWQTRLHTARCSSRMQRTDPPAGQPTDNHRVQCRSTRCFLRPWRTRPACACASPSALSARRCRRPRPRRVPAWLRGRAGAAAAGSWGAAAGSGPSSLGHRRLPLLACSHARPVFTHPSIHACPAGAQEAAVVCDCGRRAHGRGGGGRAARPHDRRPH